MQTVLRNLRFSLRMLAKNPGLTITIMLTLAFGIGATTFCAVGAILIFAAMVACYFPGRRAAAVEPMRAFRTE